MPVIESGSVYVCGCFCMAGWQSSSPLYSEGKRVNRAANTLVDKRGSSYFRQGLLTRIKGLRRRKDGELLGGIISQAENKPNFEEFGF